MIATWPFIFMWILGGVDENIVDALSMLGFISVLSIFRVLRCFRLMKLLKGGDDPMSSFTSTKGDAFLNTLIIMGVSVFTLVLLGGAVGYHINPLVSGFGFLI